MPSIIPADKRNWERDEFSRKLRTAVALRPGDSRPGVDLDKLRAIAERNGVWSDRYAAFNPGHQLMMISSRLRHLLREGVKVVLWPRVRKAPQ